MASRITIYGNPAHKDVRRLQREMNVMYVEYSLTDPRKDTRAARRLQSELTEESIPLPVVEVLREDDQGSLYLTNPDEPTLRQSLYSEGILSITAYWL